MLEAVRLLALVAIVFLSGCTSAPAPERDPAKDAWYGQTVAELAAINVDAERFFKSKDLDKASDLIQKGEPLVNRLLSIPQPTLAAMEQASDLDDLYGRMLLSNRHYGWARLLFQKNLARWKHWEPQTPETAQRLKQAESAIAECDRRMAEADHK